MKTLKEIKENNISSLRDRYNDYVEQFKQRGEISYWLLKERDWRLNYIGYLLSEYWYSNNCRNYIIQDITKYHKELLANLLMAQKSTVYENLKKHLVNNFKIKLFRLNKLYASCRIEQDQLDEFTDLILELSL